MRAAEPPSPVRISCRRLFANDPEVQEIKRDDQEYYDDRKSSGSSKSDTSSSSSSSITEKPIEQEAHSKSSSGRDNDDQEENQREQSKKDASTETDQENHGDYEDHLMATRQAPESSEGIILLVQRTKTCTRSHAHALKYTNTCLRAHTYTFTQYYGCYVPT